MDTGEDTLWEDFTLDEEKSTTIEGSSLGISNLGCDNIATGDAVRAGGIKEGSLFGPYRGDRSVGD
jgi:hypothetical protein